MAKKPDKRRSPVSQQDVPAHSLDEALRIAVAIRENLGKKPAPPIRVAAAVGLSPASGHFKSLCGASIAYGVTEGGYNAGAISITPLGDRILRPKKEGDDLVAKREAFLRPRVVREFLQQYDASPLPREDIARNVLEDLGVPSERAAEVFSMISTETMNLGLSQTIKGRTYVDLTNVARASQDVGPNEAQEETTATTLAPTAIPQNGDEEPSILNSSPVTSGSAQNRRVFITHGKSRELVEPIKQLLQFGELEAVVSVERQSVSQPVPDKVMNDMRSCGAAIIHVEGELRLIDSDAKEVIVLNPKVVLHDVGTVFHRL